jgi:heptosyltransferase-1
MRRGGALAGIERPRLLLVRTSALGDVVHCLPVLTALRRRLPAARLAWVVEESMAPLLAGHPDLDLVVPVALRRWRRAPLARTSRDGLREALAALRGFAPDAALDLMGNFKGVLLARLSGAPRVVGLSRRARREPASALFVDEPVEPPPDAVHAVDRALALLAAVAPAAAGDSPGGVDFGGDRLLPAAAPLDDGGRPYAFLHPGAGWGNKVYPAERWGAVARRLAAEAGLEVRVSLVPGEEALARRVVAAAGGAAREVPAAGLPALVSLLRGARLALGGDTGPLHLAHALGVPALFVHGPTDPRRHGPYGAPGRAVWETLPCSFCYKRLHETKACLRVVAAERVAEAALAVIGAAAAGPPVRA